MHNLTRAIESGLIYSNLDAEYVRSEYKEAQPVWAEAVSPWLPSHHPKIPAIWKDLTVYPS